MYLQPAAFMAILPNNRHPSSKCFYLPKLFPNLHIFSHANKYANEPVHCCICVLFHMTRYTRAPWRRAADTKEALFTDLRCVTVCVCAGFTISRWLKWGCWTRCASSTSTADSTSSTCPTTSCFAITSASSSSWWGEWAQIGWPQHLRVVSSTK